MVDLLAQRRSCASDGASIHPGVASITSISANGVNNPSRAMMIRHTVAVGLISTRARELLLPGVFALFDRCRQKQKQQMFATVGLGPITITTIPLPTHSHS